MTVPPPPAKPGLQAERTQLAWERTAIGFLTVGALILFPRHEPLAASRAVIAVASVVLAAATYWIGRRRADRMHQSARAEVRLVGLSTAGLAVALAVTVLVLG